jgi:hypothetical protein
MFFGRCLFLLSLVLVYPAWAYSQSKKLESVKIGYSGIGIAHDLLKMMEKNRIFEKYGLNAQGIYIGSGSLMNQAIVGGSIQFTTSDLPSQIQAALAGVDFKTIGVTINRLDGAIMTRKEKAGRSQRQAARHQPLRFGLRHRHSAGVTLLETGATERCGDFAGRQHAEPHRGDI